MLNSNGYSKFKICKLWTNPSPTAAFGPQAITLANDDYDYLLMGLDLWAGCGCPSLHIISKETVANGGHGMPRLGCAESNGTIWQGGTYGRYITYENATRMVVGAGEKLIQAHGGGIQDNSVCVPVFILGLKLGGS